MRARAFIGAFLLCAALPTAGAAQTGIEVIYSGSNSGSALLVDVDRYGEALILQRAADSAGLIVQPGVEGLVFDFQRAPEEARPPPATYAHCQGFVEGPCPESVRATEIYPGAREKEQTERAALNVLPERGTRQTRSPLRARARRVPRPVTWTVEGWSTVNTMM